MDLIIEKKQYNVGFLCTERQCREGNKDKTALTLIDAGSNLEKYTFSFFNSESNRFANLLSKNQILPGDVLFIFLPPGIEKYISLLGALKNRVIAAPLFYNFGSGALYDRLSDSKARAVITSRKGFRKIKKILPDLHHLQKIILTDTVNSDDSRFIDYREGMAEADSEFKVEITPPDTPSILHYTSGSTGKPKGVLHLHKSILYQHRTFNEVFQMDKDDVYWCSADPGWVTGTTYGIIAPWCHGISQVQYLGGYKAEKWLKILKDNKINIWYTSPTALRMMMQEDESLYREFELKDLKRIYSVGEPLNPEVISWGERVFGLKIYDTYFQTETGAIMISNRPGVQLVPGSMGLPISEIDVAILNDEGDKLPERQPGNICFKKGWDSMFAEYLNNSEAYSDKFKKGFYYTGDRGYKDEKGYYHFLGRSDDVINTAGHLISPFEVESVLLENENVAESAVIGVPDDVLFERIIAFVRLKPYVGASQKLEVDLRIMISNRLSFYASPAEMVFTDFIPKNKSGKIMRRLLKAEYLGQDPGDISTLEEF